MSRTNEIPKYSHNDYIQGSLSNCKMYFGGGGGGDRERGVMSPIQLCDLNLDIAYISQVQYNH